MAIITDGSIASDVAVGTNFTVLADDHVAFNKDARKDFCAFAGVEEAFV